MIEHQTLCSCDIYKLNMQVSAVNWELAGHIPLKRYSSVAVTTFQSRGIIIGEWMNRGEITSTVLIGSCEPQWNYVHAYIVSYTVITFVCRNSKSYNYS